MEIRAKVSNSMHHVAPSAWSKVVRNLCENECAYCKKKYDGTWVNRIEAHHIKQAAVYPEYETAIENGVALCHECHQAAHGHDYRPNRGIETDVSLFCEMALDTYLFLCENDYDKLKAAADAAGESVNGYIKRAIAERMQKEGEP